jgi:hypothetical protein
VTSAVEMPIPAPIRIVNTQSIASLWAKASTPSAAITIAVDPIMVTGRPKRRTSVEMKRRMMRLAIELAVSNAPIVPMPRPMMLWAISGIRIQDEATRPKNSA